MTIRLKKYCEICGVEILDEEELFLTCTEGILEIKNGYFCSSHKSFQTAAAHVKPGGKNSCR